MKRIIWVIEVYFRSHSLSLWFYWSMVKIIRNSGFTFSKIASLLVFVCHFCHWPISGWGEIDLSSQKGAFYCNHCLNFPLEPSLSDWDMMNPDMDSNPDFYLLKLDWSKIKFWYLKNVRKCLNAYDLVPHRTTKSFQSGLLYVF